MESEKETIKNWLLEIIEKFREKYSDREEIKEKKRIFAENFSKPCQVLVLWLKSKKQIDYQILLITHNPKINDKITKVFGPYLIDKKEDTDKIKEIIYGKELAYFVEDIENIEKYRKVLEFNIKKGYKEIREIKEPKFSSSSIIHKQDYIMFCIGKCSEIPSEDIMKSVENHLQGFPFHIEPPKYEDYIGGFIKPPIWIGEIPTQEYQDKLKSYSLAHYFQEPTLFTYKNRNGIVKQDGYIGISMGEDFDPFTMNGLKKKIVGLSDLNEIFGFMLLQGINIYSADIENFNWTTYIPERKWIAESYKEFSYAEKLHKERFEVVVMEEFTKKRQIISIEKFLDIIRLANYIASKEEKEVQRLLILIKTLTQAFTNLHNGLLLESFILSWTIIETFLDFIWEKIILKNPNVEGKRKDKLKDNRIYSASTKLEILEFAGILNFVDYKKLDKFRSIRNDAIHSLKMIKHEDAFQIHVISRNIVRNMLHEIVLDLKEEKILELYSKYFDEVTNKNKT